MATSRLARCALLVVVLLHLLLATQAALLTPLGEIGGEFEHWAVAHWWAEQGRPPDLTNLPPRTLVEGARPPLAHIAFAIALRLAGAADVTLLARRNPDIQRDDRSILLHGADEQPPFSPILRRVNAARLLGLLASVLAILGTAAVARRIAPRSTWVPVAAAALLAFDPAFASYAGAFHDTTLATALATWTLVALLGAHDAPTRLSSGRVLALGALTGLALLVSWSTAALLGAAFVLLLQRRRVDGGLRLGEALLGLLVVLGPFLAWNVTTYGDPLAARFVLPSAARTSWPADAGAAWQVVEDLVFRTVGEWGHHVDGGSELVTGWTCVLVLGLAGLLWQLARARQRLAAGPLRLVAALLLTHVAGLLVLGFDVHEPRAPLLFPVLPAAFALLAAGAAGFVGARAGALACAALYVQALLLQGDTLRVAYWPLNRATDPHFVAVDVVAALPEERLLPFLEIVSPPRDATLVEAPELRWDPGPDPETRFTVQLSYRGLATTRRSWEDDARVLHDRYRVPEEVWGGLPPGVPLQVRVIRLPDLDELATTPLEALALHASLQWRLYRRPPDPADT